MINFNAYRFTQILSIICFTAILYQYWGTSFIGAALMLTPYLLIFLLANPRAYQTKTKVVLRTIGGVLVAVLALGLLFGVGSDAQAGVGIGFAVVIQYGAIFLSEAIIGLVNYNKMST